MALMLESCLLFTATEVALSLSTGPVVMLVVACTSGALCTLVTRVLVASAKQQD